jgi:hypothetical protein
VSWALRCDPAGRGRCDRGRARSSSRSTGGYLLVDDGPDHVELAGIVQVYGAEPNVCIEVWPVGATWSGTTVALVGVVDAGCVCGGCVQDVLLMAGPPCSACAGQQRAVAGHAVAAFARSASICANKRGNSTGLA